MAFSIFEKKERKGCNEKQFQNLSSQFLSNDRASSIRVNDSNDVYVAGMSDAAVNGYSIVKYKQVLNNPMLTDENVYYPDFLSTLSPPREMNRYAKIELTSDGTPLLVVMAWDENTAYWSERQHKIRPV